MSACPVQIGVQYSLCSHVESRLSGKQAFLMFWKMEVTDVGLYFRCVEGRQKRGWSSCFQISSSMPDQISWTKWRITGLYVCISVTLSVCLSVTHPVCLSICVRIAYIQII